jgi:hypothetical protein
VGDRVYYLYTNAGGTRVKFAAVVIAVEVDAVAIRVGRYDPDTREIKTFESNVGGDSLELRSIPCSYESALTGGED